MLCTKKRLFRWSSDGLCAVERRAVHHHIERGVGARKQEHLGYNSFGFFPLWGWRAQKKKSLFSCSFPVLNTGHRCGTLNSFSFHRCCLTWWVSPPLSVFVSGFLHLHIFEFSSSLFTTAPFCSANCLMKVYIRSSCNLLESYLLSLWLKWQIKKKPH